MVSQDYRQYDYSSLSCEISNHLKKNYEIGGKINNKDLAEDVSNELKIIDINLNSFGKIVASVFGSNVRKRESNNGASYYSISKKTSSKRTLSDLSNEKENQPISSSSKRFKANNLNNDNSENSLGQINQLMVQLEEQINQIIQLIIHNEKRIDQLEALYKEQNELWDKINQNIVKKPVKNVSDLNCCLENSENIIVLTGAGISTAAGVLDFRSKGGVFDTIQQKYQIKDAAAVFSKDYFQVSIFVLSLCFFFQQI